jgi:hypothetical protein
MKLYLFKLLNQEGEKCLVEKKIEIVSVTIVIYPTGPKFNGLKWQFI